MQIITVTLAAAAPQVIDMANAGLGRISFPLGISVIPGAGASVKVEISRSPNAVADQANANWVDSALVGVTAKAESTIYGPCAALRLTSTGGTAVVEMVANAA